MAMESGPDLPDVLKQISRVITNPVGLNAEEWELTMDGGIFRDSIAYLENPFHFLFDRCRFEVVPLYNWNVIRTLFILSFPYNTFEEVCTSFGGQNFGLLHISVSAFDNTDVNNIMKHTWIKSTPPLLARNTASLFQAMECLIPTSGPDPLADMLILLGVMRDFDYVDFIGKMIMNRVDDFNKEDGERFLDLFCSILIVTILPNWNCSIWEYKGMVRVARSYKDNFVLLMALWGKWPDQNIDFERFRLLKFITDVFGHYLPSEQVIKEHCLRQIVRPESMRTPIIDLSDSDFDSDFESDPDPDPGADVTMKRVESKKRSSPDTQYCPEQSDDENDDADADAEENQCDKRVCPDPPPDLQKLISPESVLYHGSLTVFGGDIFPSKLNGVPGTCQRVFGFANIGLAVGANIDAGYTDDGVPYVRELEAHQFDKMKDVKCFLYLCDKKTFTEKVTDPKALRTFSELYSNDLTPYYGCEIIHDAFYGLRACHGARIIEYDGTVIPTFAD